MLLRVYCMVYGDIASSTSKRGGSNAKLLGSWQTIKLPLELTVQCGVEMGLKCPNDPLFEVFEGFYEVHAPTCFISI
jgi:hypothetical protein